MTVARTAMMGWGIAALAVAASLAQAQTSKDQIADLSQVPQLHETPEQRDARMQWFRDAKFGMFIHWGPCTVGDREIGWGRKANRPWDINGVQTPRTSDPDYDSYFERFNPVKYEADAWVRLAQEAGMNRDFPDGLRPTTAVGLSDEYITDRQTGKRFSCSAQGVPGRLRAILRGESAAKRPFAVDSRRPSPWPPLPPTVSSFVGVIGAPSRAAGAAECVRG